MTTPDYERAFVHISAMRSNNTIDQPLYELLWSALELKRLHSQHGLPRKFKSPLDGREIDLASIGL